MTEKKPVRRKIKRETDLIEVKVLRGIAAGKPGDIIEIERSAARKLQEVGAIMVVL